MSPKIAQKVYSVEIIPQLADRARQNPQSLVKNEGGSERLGYIQDAAECGVEFFNY